MPYNGIKAIFMGIEKKQYEKSQDTRTVSAKNMGLNPWQFS